MLPAALEIPRTDVSSPWRAGEAGGATLLYLALTLVLLFPIARHPASSVMPGDPDTDLFMWTLAWNTHALATDPLAIFDANIYHPHRRTLAFSENLIGSTPLAAPILWAGGGPILALNVVVLLSLVLSGTGAFVLARRLGLSFPAALVAGAVFAFSPARFYRLGQLHLTTIQWIPFCLAWLHAYLDHGRARDLRIALAFFTLQVVTSGHGAVFLILSAGTVVVWRVVTGEPFVLRRRLRDVGVPGLVLLVPAVLIAVPYRLVQTEFGLRRSLANWETTPESFIASVTNVDRFITSHLTDARLDERATAYLFPGYAVLLLASMALRRRGQGSPPPREAASSARRAWLGAKHSPAAPYVLLLILGLLLSAGPPLGLWPLVYWMPGFNFIRVPSRFALVGVLALSVLAGIGAQRAITGRGRRRGAAVAALAVLAITAECIAWPLPGYRQYTVRIPAADRWVARQPRPFVVAEFPVTTADRLHSTYMLHSTAHWQNTVHGHSGLRTDLHNRLYDLMRGFPDEPSLAALADFGVTYLIVHSTIYPASEWPSVAARLDRYADQLTLVHRSGPDRVYTLRSGRSVVDTR